MQTDAALVGADGGIELDPVAPVDLGNAVVVGPGDPEEDGALGLHDAVDDLVLHNVGAALHDGLQRGEDFFHSLQKFLFTGIPGSQTFVYALEIFILDCHRDHSCQ